MIECAMTAADVFQRYQVALAAKEPDVLMRTKKLCERFGVNWAEVNALIQKAKDA